MSNSLFGDGVWKDAFFVLRGTVLEYYRHQHLFLLRTGPHRKYVLSKDCVVGQGWGQPNSENEVADAGFALYIRFPHESTNLPSPSAAESEKASPQPPASPRRNLVVIALPTEKERREWIDDIKAAIDATAWANVDVISPPTNFRHNIHIPSPREEVNPSDIPADWLQLLAANGMTIDDVKQDPHTVLAVLDFASKDLVQPPPSQTSSREQLQNILDTRLRRDDPAPRFSNLTKIAEGGFGKVYVGERVEDGQRVAIKVVTFTPKTNRERLMSEVAMMYVLREHPNIVRVVETYINEQSLWVVMEFMFGGCLTDVLMHYGRLNEPEIAYVCREVLKGLSYMHHQYRLHRDIKSDNVLLGLGGEIKLADFGFSVQLTDEASRRKSMVGTYAWMAPEVIMGMEYDQRADIWSLGILCLEMAEKEPPHLHLPKVKRLQHIVNDPAPRLRNPELWSQEFTHFLSLILTKDHLVRATADQMLYHPFLRRASTPEEFGRKVIISQNGALRKSRDALNTKLATKP